MKKIRILKCAAAAMLCAVMLLCVSCDSLNNQNLAGSVFNYSYTDMYVRIDGIEGESPDSNHRKWIDISDFSLGSTNEHTKWDEGGLPGEFEPFMFVHNLDIAVPIIDENCMKGGHIKKVELHVCRAISGKQEIVFSAVMENARIIETKIEKYVDPETFDEKMVEKVWITYEKCTWKSQKVELDNALGGSVERTFNAQKKY